MTFQNLLFACTTHAKIVLFELPAKASSQVPNVITFREPKLHLKLANQLFFISNLPACSQFVTQSCFQSICLAGNDREVTDKVLLIAWLGILNAFRSVIPHWQGS